MTKLTDLALAAALSVTMASNGRASDLVGAAGTLIVGVPSAEGLVIAGDSRRTFFDGIFCDFGTKLYVPESLPFTVVGFTGLSSYSAIKIPMLNCSEAEHAPVIFDIEPIVRAFFLRSPSPVSEMDIKGLANDCVAAVTTFLVNSGPMIDRAALVARSSMLTVVLAAYEPKTKESIIREVSITLRSPTEIAAEQTYHQSYSPEGRPDWAAFGQGMYLSEHVINGIGRRFLSDRYKEFDVTSRIDGIDSALAIDVAKTLIEATSKTSEQIKIPAGVGGHIDIYSLSSDGVKKLQ